MDLTNKHVDLEVLRILVQAVENNIFDEKNRPSFVHKKDLLQLFGRLTSQVCWILSTIFICFSIISNIEQ